MAHNHTVVYEGNLKACVDFTGFSNGLTMDAPVDVGGAHETPCPLDLFSAAYGGCVIMMMDVAARRAGFTINGAKINVSLIGSKIKGGVFSGIDVTVILPCELKSDQLMVLQEGAKMCPIHHALGDHIETTMVFEFGEGSVIECRDSDEEGSMGCVC